MDSGPTKNNPNPNVQVIMMTITGAKITIRKPTAMPTSTFKTPTMSTTAQRGMVSVISNQPMLWKNQKSNTEIPKLIRILNNGFMRVGIIFPPIKVQKIRRLYPCHYRLSTTAQNTPNQVR